ncbi:MULTISPECIES: hypothetical protein [Photorhabdus]|uniref:hypothetical protein n=1 Tax=Photorhabdus TaxID=29487 RepID=UPI00069C5006|nr:hypothetical protein [Photorhabdus thracensis]MCC8422003.1 hypothetical protein [Photorhabdus thracensis]
MPIKNGNVDFKNDWGEDIVSMTIRHRRSNDPEKQEQVTRYNIASGEVHTNILSFTYETGPSSPFDYWWIKFITNSNRIYTIKDNFYCSVSDGDDGKVKLRIDGSTNQMYVDFSDSSGCTESIYPASLIFIDEQQKIHTVND